MDRDDYRYTVNTIICRINFEKPRPDAIFEYIEDFKRHKAQGDSMMADAIAEALGQRGIILPSYSTLPDQYLPDSHQ